MVRGIQAKAIYLFLFCFFIVRLGFAQQELTLFFLDQSINSTAVNPAGYRNDGIVFSLPSVAFNYGNNAFSYNELFERSGGETYLNVEGVLDQLERQNVLQMQLAVEVFRAQMRYKKSYWSLVMAEKLSVKLTYSDQLVDLAWNGNAKFIGQTIEIGPALNFTYYRELSVGWLREWGKLTVAPRLRLLAGRANITTRNEDAHFYTDPEFYQTRFKTDYEINTSGVRNFSDGALRLFSSWENPGLGMDLGVNYQLNNKWRISGSIIDVGYIKWNRNVNRYTSGGDFTFSGLELNRYFELDTLDFDDYVDSVRNQFVAETKHNAYVSQLTPKVYLGATVVLNDKQRLGALMYGEFLSGLHPAFSLFYGHRIRPKLEVGVTYAYKNKVFHHPGLAFTKDWGRLQVLFVSDDVVNLFIPRDSKNINFRFGLNIGIGKEQKGSSNASFIHDNDSP
jgi:hypothetical protein